MSLEDFKAAQKTQAAQKAARIAAAKATLSQDKKPMPQEMPEHFKEPLATPEPAAPSAPAVAAPEPAPAVAAPAVANPEPADDWEEQAEKEEDDAQAVKEEEVVQQKAPEPVIEIAKPAVEKKQRVPEPTPSPPAEEEEVAPVEVAEGEKKLPDPRAHLNVVFIGHVDAGKSTTCGNILYLSGCVDERTIEKYMKEAKDKNRESWFLAYIMDTSDEEKAKGKTVEVGRAAFETENRRFTVLDAPGHKSYVPNMISGASQADVGVLIISARRGEFETGFERGGQTREHALLAKTLGVDKLIIAVNKMDDPSVEWREERYTEIVKKMTPFLKTSGFKDEQVVFLPMSGLTGDNVKEKNKSPSWVSTKSLLDTLDSIDTPSRNKDGPLRIPMLDGFKDMGATMAIGKVEQGTVRPGQKVVVMPIGHKCTITSVFIKDEEMQYATCGENVVLKMHGISEGELQKGFVMSDPKEPVRVVTKFKAQLHVIELPDERPVLTSGYRAIFHSHVAAEECEIMKLYECMSMTDRKKKEKNPRFVRENSVVTCSISLARATSLDSFTGVHQLGRFTLRDEGRTIAIGKITELPKDK